MYYELKHGERRSRNPRKEGHNEKSLVRTRSKNAQEAIKSSESSRNSSGSYAWSINHVEWHKRQSSEENDPKSKKGAEKSIKCVFLTLFVLFLVTFEQSKHFHYGNEAVWYWISFSPHGWGRLNRQVRIALWFNVFSCHLLTLRKYSCSSNGRLEKKMSWIK